MFYLFFIYMSTLQLSSNTHQKCASDSKGTMWFLGIELRTSARKVNALNCWSISSDLHNVY